jgi:hypothetical protein
LQIASDPKPYTLRINRTAATSLRTCLSPVTSMRQTE